MKLLRDAVGALGQHMSSQMQQVSGIILFRFTAVALGLVTCGHTWYRISIGEMEGDPVPWITVCLTMGVPTVVASILRLFDIIDAHVELFILKVSFACFVAADSGFMAYSTTLKSQDIWMKSALSPAAYNLWGCSLRAMSKVAAHDVAANQVIPCFILTISLMVRGSWDADVSGLLFTTFAHSLSLQASILLLTEMHHNNVKKAEQLSMERQVQETLLSAAFDAIMQVARVPAPDWDEDLRQSTGLVFHGNFPSLNNLLGANMHRQPLHAGINHGIEQLDELMRISEESLWNPEALGVLRRGLITCCDTHGQEFECEIRIVVQAPTSTDPGSLLCGLNLVGEKRQAPFTAHLSEEEHIDKQESDSAAESAALHSSASINPISYAFRNISQQLRGLSTQLFQAGSLLKPAEVGIGHETGSVVWDVLSQGARTCAFCLHRKNLTILQQTHVAKQFLRREPGQHVSSALAHAGQAVILRKAVEVVENKLQSNPDMHGYHARPRLALSWLTSDLVAANLETSFIFLPAGWLIAVLHMDEVAGDPTTAWLQQRSPKAPILDEGSSIMPDDSASQVSVDVRGAVRRVSSTKPKPAPKALK
mmetsp:Transcript_15995/g.36622  ORF Transcript_15995/g.36622 Transcript_15995/m.36622 type:complete len:594 (-) Transcript_15995:79-1860(-)